MKILMIANTLPPVDLSGAGEQVVQLAHGLRSQDHEVEILGRGPGGARGPKVLFPLTIVIPALRSIAAMDPDVVQLHESDGGLVALVLALKRRRFALVALQQVSYLREFKAVRALRKEPGGAVIGRPVASELVFKWCRAPIQFVLGWCTSRLSDLVLAPSDETGRELRADYGAKEVACVPNATGAPLGRPDGDAAVKTEEAEGALLYVGRLRIRKGVEVLLESLSILAARGLTPRMTIVGDGERLEVLQDRARSLGLGHVSFVGRQNASEIGVRLGSALALVVPSTYEGMPLVILEAMDRSCPVIASAVSGIPEVVVHGESGWLVAPEDAVALADAIAEALAAPEEASRRGAVGRRLLDNTYRPEHAAEVWLASLEQLVGPQNHPAEQHRKESPK